MAFDLDRMSREELQSLRRDVDKALESLESRRRKEALEAAEKAAAEHGFNLNEILGGKGKKPAGRGAAAKYRNPEDGTQTWSGRGRQPGWFKEAISAGKSPESMEV